MKTSGGLDRLRRHRATLDPIDHNVYRDQRRHFNLNRTSCARSNSITHGKH